MATRAVQTRSEVLVPRYVFISVVVMLAVLGAVMVYSASTVQSLVNDGGAADYFFDHLLHLSFSVVMCAAVATVGYRMLRAAPDWLTWLLWGSALFALLFTVVMGQVGELGAQRWLNVGGVTFQVSEFMKIACILAAAHLISGWHGRRYEGRRFWVLMLMAAGLPLLFVVLQPDLGSTVFIAVTMMAMLLAGGVSGRIVVSIAGSFAALALAVALSFDYMRSRLRIDPWTDPQGDGYQVIMGFYAFATGGLGGVGFGSSRQKYAYLPEAHTDFIFAIIGEELGLWGTLGTVLLFLLLVWSGMRIATHASDTFDRLVAVGATVSLGVQAFVNMGCVTGLLPLTGKTLPFISSGGSSLVSVFILVGLILAVSYRSDHRDVASRRRERIRVVEGGRR